jgi:malic enzyme
MKALRYHARPPAGKIQVTASKPCDTAADLALAYTPGVARPSLAISRRPESVYRYTGKGNLVAIVSNGTAVLGLGNLGPLAAKPVMEGKALLFKRLADIDAFDLEIDVTNPDEIVRVVTAIAPTFGGINLEDIKAPECVGLSWRLPRRVGRACEKNRLGHETGRVTIAGRARARVARIQCALHHSETAGAYRTSPSCIRGGRSCSRQRFGTAACDGRSGLRDSGSRADARQRHSDAES